jgi:hypothetical protein
MDHSLSRRIHGNEPLGCGTGERQDKGITVLAFLYCYYDSILDLCRGTCRLLYDVFT